MNIFCDVFQAAALLGLKRRTFDRQYVETKKIRIIGLRSGKRTANEKYFFLRTDVEKLKKERESRDL